MWYHLALILLFSGAAFGAPECPCTLVDAVKTTGFRWDCRSRGLIEMPGICFTETHENVTEVDLRDNSLAEVLSIDFAEMSDVEYLWLSYNKLDFVDPTSLDYMQKLKALYFEQNSPLEEFVPITLRSKPALEELYFFSSPIGTAPSLTSTNVLRILDLRNTGLSQLPTSFLSADLITTGANFVFSATGNVGLIDVAANILLPIPSESKINFDPTVTIWCQDQTEKDSIFAKNWDISINLNNNVKICNTDGLPDLATQC